MSPAKETISEAMARVKEAANLNEFCAEHLSPKGKTFVCPACGSGNGPNGTPAFSIKNGKWKCFSCGRGGDVFDLQGIISGTDDKGEQLEAVASWARVPGMEDGGTSRQAPAPVNQAVPARQTSPNKQRQYEQGREEVRRYIEDCSRQLTRLDQYGNVVWADTVAGAYLETRGFDSVDAGRMGFGFDPQSGGAQDADGNWCRYGRIILPWPVYDKGEEFWPWYYTARSIDPSSKKAKYLKPADDKVGGQPDVDASAMGHDVLYVVEGLMDAWAVEAAGDGGRGWPVPLGGTSNARRVATQIADQGYKGVVVLMCDNDAAGIDASDTMAEILSSKGIRWAMWPWSDGEHDPADSWRDTGRNFGAFAVMLREWSDGGAEEAYRARVAAEAAERSASCLTNPLDVLERIYSGDAALDPVRTRIDGLDRILGGGLMPGSVTVIGASSSSGKTTMTLQVCNAIAESGMPCLFVTIEMTPEELVSKSIAWASSKLTGIKCGRNAITAIGMRNNLIRSMWTLDQHAHMMEAAEWYTANVANNVRFMHAEGCRPTVDDIWSAAELMGVERGRVPAVFIDYLQVLGCPEGSEGKETRLAVDDNMIALRNMAQSLKTPVWVVSSVGRSAYYGAVGMDSYKESGGVEFSSDVALGLQVRDMAEATEAGRSEAMMKAKGKAHDMAEREKSQRNVELTVLKNRYGRVSPLHGVPLVYCCETDRFIEVQAGE